MCEKCVRAIEDLDLTAVIGNADCTPAMESVIERMQAACVAEIRKTCAKDPIESVMETMAKYSEDWMIDFSYDSFAGSWMIFCETQVPKTNIDPHLAETYSYDDTLESAAKRFIFYAESKSMGLQRQYPLDCSQTQSY